MIIPLTKKQAKLLERHFQVVEMAYHDNRRGMLVAQIKEGYGEPYMIAGFLTEEECLPLVGKATEKIPRTPHGWGIPAPRRSNGSEGSSPNSIMGEL
jgi:hypothetical protein